MLTFNEQLQQAQYLKETQPKFTGKRLVMLGDKATSKAIHSHAKNAAMKIASFSDFTTEKADYTKAFDDADGIVFEEFGVAVINEGREKQISMLTESTASKSTFTYSEPERYVYAVIDSFEEFMRGYKSAVDDIYSKVSATRKGQTASGTYNDDAIASWGVHATNLLLTKYTGKDVNIAILDTGFNLEHPDFAGRNITHKSFVRGQKVDDLNGHGSHCAGLAAGNINIKTGRRYGAAKEANIFIGKILSNAGSGTDSSILAGMEWALINKCKVISMSLGAPVAPGETYSKIYDDIAKKALERGTIIIAAAGNESSRKRGVINAVGHPANCPSIMAVAALDNMMNVADFSCGCINTDGGQIDIAGPGVDVFSSWMPPGNYETISGTSMATPCVAGIAALYWQQNPAASAATIWMNITQHAKRLSLNSTDVGSGLIQAPK